MDAHVIHLVFLGVAAILFLISAGVGLVDNPPPRYGVLTSLGLFFFAASFLVG